MVVATAVPKEQVFIQAPSGAVFKAGSSAASAMTEPHLEFVDGPCDTDGRVRFMKAGPKAEYPAPGSQAVTPVLPEQDFDMRFEKLYGMMDEMNLDLVVLSSMHNVKYFSNFLYCAFGRTYLLVILKESKRVALFTAGIDSLAPRRNAIRGVENYIVTDWRKDNMMAAVADFAGEYVKSKSVGEDTCKVGLEFDHASMKVFAQLQETFGLKDLSSFVNVSETLMTHRLVKARGEIKIIADASRICCVGADAIIEFLRAKKRTGEEVREHQVAMVGTDCMTELIAKEYPGAEVRDVWVWFQSGENTDGAHNAVSLDFT